MSEGVHRAGIALGGGVETVPGFFPTSVALIEQPEFVVRQPTAAAGADHRLEQVLDVTLLAEIVFLEQRVSKLELRLRITGLALQTRFQMRHGLP